MFESKRRYGLSVLNFVVTSNHIHLLVVDDGVRETIPKSSASAGRQVRETPEEYELREETSPYDFNLGSKKEDICLENMCFWSTLHMISGYYGGPTPQRQVSSKLISEHRADPDFDIIITRFDACNGSLIVHLLNPYLTLQQCLFLNAHDHGF